MSEPLNHDGRDYPLSRWPQRRGERLRAWDTADLYLLQTVAPEPGQRVLVIEDGFGALAVPLAHTAPVVWSDSEISRRALRRNLGGCGLDPDLAVFVPADTEPAGRFDVVLARFPKALAHWEDTLLRLRRHVHRDTRIVAGGMIKHTPRRAFELMERLLGPTRTSRGWKKARLAEAWFEADRTLPFGKPEAVVTLDDPPLTLRHRANVFARDHLDVGTRMLLRHLPAGCGGRLADLGCGGGVLALSLALRNPQAEVLGVDTSYQAVASARDNARAAGLATPSVAFAVADGLADSPPAAFDLVVCNPPFHQDRTVGDMLAWRMFTQASRALVAGGRLLVVGNRGLDHGQRLVRIFGGVEQVEAGERFEVLEAVRR